MRVVQSTLEKAMARLYKTAVGPYATVVDETELENEWLLITGLRRSDFHQILDDMKRRRFVIERAHASARWIEFTTEGTAFMRAQPAISPIQELSDWLTLKRASLRKFKQRMAAASAVQRRMGELNINPI